MTILPKMITQTPAKQTLLINAPEYYQKAVSEWAETVDFERGKTTKRYDFIQIFCIHSSELEDLFPLCKKQLAAGGKLWASWPKARQLSTDLNLDSVIKIGYANGLVESNNIRIDDIWTALKFTHPKPGKVYNNSHAKLVQ